MATDPTMMSSKLCTPTTALLTLGSRFARLLTILQNFKQSCWTSISLQYLSLHKKIHSDIELVYFMNFKSKKKYLKFPDIKAKLKPSQKNKKKPGKNLKNITTNYWFYKLSDIIGVQQKRQLI